MARIAGEIIINRPVETVFDFVADERNEPSYNSSMSRAEKISNGPIGIGTKFRADTVSRGRNLEMIIEFIGYERPRRLVSITHLSSMEITGELRFETVSSGTRMQWSWNVKPQGFLKLMTPLIKTMGEKQEKQIWSNLKQLLETQAPHSK